MTDKQRHAELTLGPVLFNWPEEQWRDFYFKIADEAPVDTVYLGEVICSKRMPFYEPYFPEVVERLGAAGKKIIFSSLALVMNRRERDLVRELASDAGLMVEANDMSAVSHLSGRPFVAGPYINVYNEDTMELLHGKGATIFCLPCELPAESIEILSSHAQKIGANVEIQVYGRVPLALSARCYHARARGLTKDSCRFVCKNDPDGMALKTLEDQPFIVVNGIQTMSYTCLNLVGWLPALQDMGINRFRLLPHSCDMAGVASIFRETLDGHMDTLEAEEKLAETGLRAPFSDGFMCDGPGHTYSGKQP
jgi:collagenase-like PrtC family protease